MQVLPVHQLNYSDPLHAVDDCPKCSESAVGFVTQWKPSIFAVKILAVWAKTEGPIEKHRMS